MQAVELCNGRARFKSEGVDGTYGSIWLDGRAQHAVMSPWSYGFLMHKLLVAERSLPSGWLQQVGPFQRNEEDEAVLAALQALREALLEELIASIEANELIGNPLRRFLRNLFRRMERRLATRNAWLESVDLIKVLWEARPFALALQMRLTAMLLQRFEQRLQEDSADADFPNEKEIR
eukprot:s590_g31.t1